MDYVAESAYGGAVSKMTMKCYKKCRGEGNPFYLCIHECFSAKRGTQSVPLTLSSLVRQATEAKSTDIYVPDRHMHLPTDEDVKRWLDINQEDKKAYIAGRWNCDDTARNVWNDVRNQALREGKNAAYALVWTPSHALNMYVNDKQKVIYIEPQEDAMTSIHSVPRLILF